MWPFNKQIIDLKALVKEEAKEHVKEAFDKRMDTFEGNKTEFVKKYIDTLLNPFFYKMSITSEDNRKILVEQIEKYVRSDEFLDAIVKRLNAKQLKRTN